MKTWFNVYQKRYSKAFDEVVVGMRFLADTDIGPVPVVITEVDGDEVVVDGNHMLAGQELHFTVEVVGTREATLEEIAHGHVHGAHDHHHFIAIHFSDHNRNWADIRVS